MFQVNAFVQAGQGFTGNPAGVCVWPPEIKATDALLQAIAAEVNCSETSFLLVRARTVPGPWCHVRPARI